MLLAPLLIVLSLTLTSCGGKSGSEPAHLVFINGGEVTALDPVAVSDQISGRIITSLFEGLMRYNEQGRSEPGCALPPEVSADGRIYTFRIRPEACWTDGNRVLRPVTSGDFVRSWRRFLEPANAAEYANIFWCIAGAEAYSTKKTTDFSQVGIQAPDDRTLIVTLASPTPYFLDLIAFMCFCPVYVAEGPDQARGHFKPGQVVTNGAFLLQDWRLNDRIRLKRNPHYWDAQNVRLDSVDVLPISNASTALQLFLTGDADLILDKGLIPPNLGNELRNKPYFHYKQFLGSWFLRFNCQAGKPFANPLVRRAFALVVDKKRITDKITQYGENPAFSLTPPGAGENYQPPPGLKLDVAEARRLMKEAGFPDGSGFPVVDYLYPTLSIEQSIAVELQSMWEKNLGVKVTFTKQEYKTYLESQSGLHYDICRSSWIGDYNDPNTFLDMFTTNSGNNRTGWGNADYDKFIAASAAEPDQKKRHAIFQSAEDMLVSREAVVVPVYHYVGIQFYHEDRLGGVSANLTDEHPLRVIHLKAKGR